MPWRILMRFLINENTINKLADSRIIRRAAKLTVGLIHRAKLLKPEDAIEDIAKRNIQKATATIKTSNMKYAFVRALEQINQKLKSIIDELEKQNKK